MGYISQIELPSGGTYDIKDSEARTLIAALQGSTKFLGVTTTNISDGSTTRNVVIGGNTIEAQIGDIVTKGSKEFVWNGTAWQEFGDLGALGDLAYKDTASGNFTPAGTVSQPTFTGSSSNVSITATDAASGATSGTYKPKGTVSKPSFTGTSTTFNGNFTPEGSVSVSTATTTNKTATVSKTTGTATYTPEGTVSAPTISVSTAGSTGTVKSVTAVGSMPTWEASVSNEKLMISWTSGVVPTTENVTVKTGDAAYTATAPTFTGTGARLVTGNIAVPNTYSASFTGTEGSISASGTPNGSVSQPTFSGQYANFSGTTTPSGTVSQPTFTGTQGTVTVS